MLITSPITKKVLEAIIHKSFTTFGNISSSSLLDSLKLLGFYYATNSGISINIEDLKTPDIKKKILITTSKEITKVSLDWEQGFITEIERFQSIIDNWNSSTESLKIKIIEYYRKFDPANSLYIMAFSGARGNMSQVRQLVGMRGLMADQEGNIIDLPIQANFREGLSSIDYIISSYGARKGIVDTALKTADSGYLTRRLIYIAQDLVIREIDCNTKTGIIILLTKNNNFTNILGRFLIKTQPITFLPSNTILDEKSLKKLKGIKKKIETSKNNEKFSLTIRSPLTCNSSSSICQKCYGWDLSETKLISLGEAVGIIAAQSIGEPGTQLTMRTFHTGGIFTSELVQQTLAPFSGRIIIPSSFKSIPYRTNHGILVARLQQETKLLIINWEGIQKEISLEMGSFLYITCCSFIKKGQLISEYSTRSALSGTKKLKPIYTNFDGQLKFQNLSLRIITLKDNFKEKKEEFKEEEFKEKESEEEESQEEESKLQIIEREGTVWLTSGKIFRLPQNSELQVSHKLIKYKAIAKLNIISPMSGLFTIKNNQAKVSNSIRAIDIKLPIKKAKEDDFGQNPAFKNIIFKVSIATKNYQYIDAHTIIGFLYIFQKYEGKIYLIKHEKENNDFFFITESDIWKVNSDQVNNFKIFPKYRGKIKAGDFLNQTSKVKKSGFFLKKDGFKMIFQTATPIFLTHGAIVNYTQGSLIFKNQVLATLINYRQQTEDIVQGLPKIEELIEARIPKNKCYLSKLPGVVVDFESTYYTCEIKNNVIKFQIEKPKNAIKFKRPLTPEDKIQTIEIIHNPFSFDNRYNIVLFKNSLYKISIHEQKVAKLWMFIRWESEDYDIQMEELRALKIDYLYKVDQNKSQKWKLVKIIGRIQNKKVNGILMKSFDNNYYFLEKIELTSKYEVPSNLNFLFNPGDFVDLGEPITEGIINPHELLSILFNYHSGLDGITLGTIRSLNKFQLILVNSIQSIYKSQGVNISSKHIEIIARQMTAKVRITDSGDTPLLPTELISFSLLKEICKSFKNAFPLHKTPEYEPVFLSTTNSSLGKEGFLSPAGFQETKRVLTKAAIEGKSDWLRGLKESVISGRLIPAGSTFLNYKNYLDNIHLYKKEEHLEENYSDALKDLLNSLKKN
jgi:hypothetical protein